MVLTHPEHRGRGYARLLMETVLGELKRRGVVAVKLDGTAMGRPLYLSLGFADECAVERWMRPGGRRPDFPGVEQAEVDG